MNGKRVFFLALDSADPELLIRWMDDGSLPALAALRERSLHGPLGVPRGFGSDAIWPSVYTGVDPSRHGRYYHLQDEAGSYRRDMVRSTQLRCPTVWEVMSDAGKRVAVIDLPKSPGPCGVNGLEILDWRSHFSYPREFRTHPVSQGQVVRDGFGEATPCPCVTRRYSEPKPHSMAWATEWLCQDVRSSLHLMLERVRGGDWDLFMGGLRGLHCAGHQLWHMHDPEHPWYPLAGDPCRDPLKDVYQAVDRVVGALLGELPTDTAVVLFAGPGMGPAYVRRELLDNILLALDRGSPSTAGRVGAGLKSLWHHLPRTVRLPLSGLAHRAAHRLVEYDRSARPFYPVQTNDSVCGIRVNLQGREPHGLIDASALESTCTELVDAIAALLIVDTGEPLALDVFRTSDVYGGPFLELLPDVLIEWNHKAPVRAVESPRTGLVQQGQLPEWSGTHRGQALALLSVPGITGGTLPCSAGIMDIAPSIAALCGVELAGADGGVLLAAAH